MNYFQMKSILVRIWRESEFKKKKDLNLTQI